MSDFNRTIRQLNTKEIDLICAGEVVLHPCSVVKELLENAIDVQSQNIQVILKNGGNALIQVVDDGCGMNKEQIKLAIEKHSTSKFHDLNNIKYLGFRGEALYAIKQCSHLNIVSSTNNQGYGYDIQGIVHSHNLGTTVIVEDLFYNIPARKKFLKTPSQEYQKIYKLMENYSVIYSDVNFTLINQGKVEKFNGKQDIIKITQAHAEDFQYEENGIKIQGYILKYSIKHKYLISVNNRMVHSTIINRVIQNIYGNISGKRDLSYVIFITVPFDQIDVNVHPSKMEIRFYNEQLITKIITKALQFIFEPMQLQDTYSNNVSKEHMDINSIASFYKDTKPVKKNKCLLQDNQDTIDFNHHNQQNELLNLSKVIDQYCGNNNTPEKPLTSKQMDLHVQQLCLGDPIGQVFNRYIITSTKDQLIIIDQHAAAERILSEQLKSSLQVNKTNLLTPIVKTLHKQPGHKHIEELNKLFEYNICQDKLIINAIPSILPESIIHDTIDILDYHFLQKSILDQVHEYGCRNSLKSGSKLNYQEMVSLIENLESVKNASFCNHGRPVFRKLNTDYIDKLFLRKK